tara:strand:- start:238 stop:2100 length:1863 start_codon:yes stop_codon:yes gene_type:complete
MLDAGAGIVGNFWFGERVTVSRPLSHSLQYMIPTENSIGRSLTPVDFADEYIDTLKEAYSFHPEIDSVNIEMNTKFSAGGVFEGYQYKIPQIGTAAANKIPDAEASVVVIPTFTNIATDGFVTWDGSELNGDEGHFAQLQPRAGEGGPISLFNGSLVYDVADLDNFTVGLSRPYCQILDVSTVDGQGDGGAQTPEDVFKPDVLENGLGVGEMDFYDYAAEVGSDGYLRLYHSIPAPELAQNDSNRDIRDLGPKKQGEGVRMTEIVYYQKNNTSFTEVNTPNSSFATGTPIVWSGSAGTIEFNVCGERVTISISGTDNVLASPTKVNASTKGQVPKPIAQTCWKMYPTVSFWADDEPIEITKYNCRTESTMWLNQPENSWITRTTMAANLGNYGSGNGSSVGSTFFEPESALTQPWNNAQNWGLSIDMRDMFVPYQGVDAVPATAQAGGLIPAHKGVFASIIAQYENVFIVGDSQRYMDRAIQQFQPNSGFILGFYPMGFSPLAGMLDGGFVGASFASSQRPSLMSQHTSFIRVPTFTHETYNFGTGNPSKILFQIPRFDNAGTETGALFYQNNDKTYIDLNNTTELRVTELDVHIVKKSEKFVEDLTGSTEVVFHIRKKL